MAEATVEEETRLLVEQAGAIWSAVSHVIFTTPQFGWRLGAVLGKLLVLHPYILWALLTGAVIWVSLDVWRRVLYKNWDKTLPALTRYISDENLADIEDFDDDISDSQSVMTRTLSRKNSTSDLSRPHLESAEDTLRQMHVLADLDADCQDFLFSQHKVLTFGPKELVFEQGAPRDAFLVVKSGEVVVEPGVPKSQQEQQHSSWRGSEYTLQPGDEVVGLLFLLASLSVDNGSNSAAPPKVCQFHCSSARTGSGGAEVLSIPISAFSSTFDRFPNAMQAMIRRLCVRTSLVTFKTLTSYFGLEQEIVASSTYTSVDAEPSELASMQPQEAFSRFLHGASSGAVRDKNVDEVLANATTLECKKGEYALAPQQRAKYVLILLEGELKICLHGAEDAETERLRRKKWGSQATAGHNVNLGEAVGGLSILTDAATPLLYECITPCKFAALPREAALKMLELSPRAWCVRLLHVMAARTGSWMHRVDAALHWVHVSGGQSLYRKGEDSMGFFVVLSGRLVALEEQERANGERPHWHVNEILHRGRLCGELDCLSDMTYSQTVRASRDSEVCRVTPNVLHLISIDFPQAMLHFSSILGRPKVAPTHADESRNKATIAVVPADEDVDVQDVCQRLTSALGTLGKTLHVSPDAELGSLGSTTNTARSLEKARFSRLLAGLEERCRWLIYEAEPSRNGEVTDWTRRCIRQADHILVVVKFDGSQPGNVPMTANEQCVEDAAAHIDRELLLIHHLKERSKYDWLGARTRDTMRPGLRGFVGHKLFRDHNKEVSLRSTRHYLNTRPWARRWHHIRQDDFGDWARCARLMVGQAIGLCLGGGGARGNCHVGLLQACHELGIPVDVVAGTSFGALVGAVYCMVPETEGFQTLLAEVMNKKFSTMKMLMDFTFPRTSYFTGAYINSILKYVFARRRCEDLLVRYACTSTDINNFATKCHWEGPLWRIVRASMSLVGLVPPIPFEGGLLVDGGYSNQYPIEALKQNGAGVVICAVACGDFGPMNTSYGDTLKGGWTTFRGYFGCCRRNSEPDPPTQAEIQERLMFYMDNTKGSRKLADITLYPDISPYGLLDFSKFKEIADVGYAEAKPKLTEWLKSDAAGAQHVLMVINAVDKSRSSSRSLNEVEYGDRKKYGKFRRAAQQVFSKSAKASSLPTEGGLRNRARGGT